MLFFCLFFLAKFRLEPTSWFSILIFLFWKAKMVEPDTKINLYYDCILCKARVGSPCIPSLHPLLSASTVALRCKGFIFSCSVWWGMENAYRCPHTKTCVGFGLWFLFLFPFLFKHIWNRKRQSVPQRTHKWWDLMCWWQLLEYYLLTLESSRHVFPIMLPMTTLPGKPPILNILRCSLWRCVFLGMCVSKCNVKPQTIIEMSQKILQWRERDWEKGLRLK